MVGDVGDADAGLEGVAGRVGGGGGDDCARGFFARYEREGGLVEAGAEVPGWLAVVLVVVFR